MPDVFLSYSREDQVTARRFADALQREGFSVWWDQALEAGEAFDRVTEKALEEAKAVVVLWSTRSVQSDWVRAEATQARANDKLVPVTIERCKRPIMFELTHTADLSAWNGDRKEAGWHTFVAGLRRLVEKGISPAPASASQAHGTPSTSTATPSLAPRRTTIAWAAIAALIAIGAGLYWQFHSREGKPPATATGSPTATSPTTLASIAVLPFKDMSQNRDQEYFADGVTEEILNTLTGLKDLKVTARTSAFAFKGKDVDLRTVGETLGVQHILEGSIRKDGEKLRITAQLIDAKSDVHVWSRTYDRPLKDIFSVQEDIARSVAEALQVVLGVGFGKQPSMTRDVEAYDAYLAAWPLMLRYLPETQRRAIGLLEQAVERDPTFGETWVRLASAYRSMSGLVTKDVQDWQQKADAAIENARRLVPESPALRLQLAERSIVQGRWSEAAGHLETKAAASTAAATGLYARGRFLTMVGSTREAVAILEQQKARDPLNPLVSLSLAVAYISARDYPASTAELKRGYALDPSLQYLFRIVGLSNALATRDQAEVRRLMDAILADSPTPQEREFNVGIISVLDRPADALAHFRKLSRDPSITAVAMTGISQWLAYYGDPESALDAHRFAMKGAANRAASSLWFPAMREVRKLPEFKPLVRDFGLVDYWREYGWGDFCKPVGTDDFECN